MVGALELDCEKSPRRGRSQTLGKSQDGGQILHSAGGSLRALAVRPYVQACSHRAENCFRRQGQGAGGLSAGDSCRNRAPHLRGEGPGSRDTFCQGVLSCGEPAQGHGPGDSSDDLCASASAACGPRFRAFQGRASAGTPDNGPA